MYACMCNWVTLLCSRKLREHSKPAMMEKIKIIIKKKKEGKLREITGHGICVANLAGLGEHEEREEEKPVSLNELLNDCNKKKKKKDFIF